MIYDLHTYNLRVGGVARFEERFGELLAQRSKFSPLAGSWHTEIGPLNQVVQVWPYKDQAERDRVRAAVDGELLWPAPVQEFILTFESDLVRPAPFMRPMGQGAPGPVYEMRTYSYLPGAIPEVLARWGDVIGEREKLSPLLACWHTAGANPDRFIHVWPYADLAARSRIRQEALKSGQWPPKAKNYPARQENKVLLPASFSPLK